MKIEELKKAINKSNIDTETKAGIDEILKLVTELANENLALVEIHTRIPRIYYAAAMYGLGSAIFGIFSVLHFAVICGVAVFLIALIGILEMIYVRDEIKKKSKIKIDYCDR